MNPELSITEKAALVFLLIVLAAGIFALGMEIASHEACRSLGYDGGDYSYVSGEPRCYFNPLNATVSEWWECNTQNYCPPYDE